MGMAPGPEILRAEQKELEAERAQVVVKSTAPPTLQQLRRTVSALWWEYHKRQLDLIQLAADTDRRHEIARNQSLRLINEGHDVVIAAINDIFGLAPEPVAPRRRGKE